MKVGDVFKFRDSGVPHACEIIELLPETVRLLYLYAVLSNGTTFTGHTTSVSVTYFKTHAEPLTKLERLLWNIK